MPKGETVKTPKSDEVVLTCELNPDGPDYELAACVGNILRTLPMRHLMMPTMNLWRNRGPCPKDVGRNFKPTLRRSVGIFQGFPRHVGAAVLVSAHIS